MAFSMAFSPFCEECGSTFERVTAKFCRECRTPRGTCAEGTKANRQLTLLMEAATEEPKERPMEGQSEPPIIVEDFRGPPARQAVIGHQMRKPPTYNMIFDLPFVHNRVKNKLYGRKCLREDYAIQHKCYTSNQRTIHKWIEEGQSSGILPEGEFNLEDPLVRNVVKKLIRDKGDELMDINFGSGKKYAWKENDVYKKLKKYLKYKRYRKRQFEKVEGVNTSVNLETNTFTPAPLERVDSPCTSQELEDVEEDDEVTFVMRCLESENIHEMYSRLSTFIMVENNLAKSAKRRIPFPLNSKSSSDAEKLHVVAEFFRHQQIKLKFNNTVLEGYRIAYPSRSDPEAVEILPADLQRLEPMEFLNDTIIDFYIKYIQRPDFLDSDEKGRFHFFNSFFYKKLSEVVGAQKKKGKAEFSNLRKWTKGTNIFEKEYLFVPIHDKLHWSLAIISFPGSDKGGNSERCIIHLDSMTHGHDSQRVFRLLKSYLVAEWKHSVEDDVVECTSTMPNLKAINIPCKKVPVPLQENESDCGLFLLHYISKFVECAPKSLNLNKLDGNWDDLGVFGRDWFLPTEASSLRTSIQEQLHRLFDQEIHEHNK